MNQVFPLVLLILLVQMITVRSADICGAGVLVNGSSSANLNDRVVVNFPVGTYTGSFAESNQGIITAQRGKVNVYVSGHVNTTCTGEKSFGSVELWHIGFHGTRSYMLASYTHDTRNDTRNDVDFWLSATEITTPGTRYELLVKSTDSTDSTGSTGSTDPELSKSCVTSVTDAYMTVDEIICF